MAAEYTIASTPPPTVQKERFSMWEALFEECRRFEGEWRRTLVALKKTTASQLASDIRNAHKREFAKSRLKGLNPNERWDAAWGEDNGEYYIWIRFLGKDK